jgi:hypothetical protein
MTNPVSSSRKRQAASTRTVWASMPRRARRAAARWWWRTSTRTEQSWPEQWRSINAARGVVDIPAA